eukprot:CAMPEP_0168543566 /NCGR_PEP_ID=MMETSP0413-20121227/1950_1 /TAXON_ID=136452 /ORGANISM="Filamoeba nolandi, Strain NC-AS-23-1" /LENGTH=173 /DNA_ID=CAMNT_0008573519 /DNA_START=23 /DNA_END=541 /DNA_ORIENTATION=+
MAEELDFEIVNGPDPVGVHQTPSQILPQLYLGALYDAQDVQKLKQLGITHVLNMAHVLNSVDAKFYEPHGIKYKGLFAIDTDSFDISKYFDETYAYILDAITSDTKILVNCAAGISRSATIVAHFIHRYSLEHTPVEDVKTIRNSSIFFGTYPCGRCQDNTRGNSLFTKEKAC